MYRACLIALIIITILSSGCTPQRRLERLIKNHPELTQTDTISIIHRDTIIIESVNYDTITNIIRQDSTVVYNNEKVFLRYYYDTLRQEIYHEVECKSDTIYYEKTIKVEVAKPVVIQKINYIWYIIIFLLIGLLGYLIVKKLLK